MSSEKLPPPSALAGEPTKKKGRVLVVDDEQIVLRALSRVLTDAGFEVLAIEDPVEGLAAAMEPGVDVAMFDIKMPNLSGLDLLRAVKQRRPEVEVIIMTGFATVQSAVEAVKGGAYDYVTKPFDNIEGVALAVGKAAERKMLVDQNRNLQGLLQTRTPFEGLIGQAAAMRSVFKMIESISGSSATVLVQGESGTGKELVARAIHERSPRKSRPFVAVNCSALTETLLESELFGHVRGAFTGAMKDKKGLFEAADGGTLFLDEIGDMPPATQVRLLRAIQEGEIKPVGSHENSKVDVRIIAATNVDLSVAKAKGRFREDLFYRLNVIAIHLPPLRDRADDVPLLAYHFLKKHAVRQNKNRLTRIEPSTLELLQNHRWVGNVRELENVIERAVILGPGESLTAEDLPPTLTESRRLAEVDTTSLSHLPYAQAKKLATRAFERRYLSGLLERTGRNISSAARAAGMDRSNFRRLLKQYEVLRPSEEGGEGDDDSAGVDPIEAN
jgi:DNA-binding NtrC family response regulator